MAPKTASTATKKSAAAPAHGSYKDMIKDAIIALKDRQGSSRQALKKYIQANNSSIAGTAATFDSLFNKALRTGVEKGDFNQPKGPSGPVKLAKKEAAPKKTEGAVKKAAPKAKATGVKKTTTKKAAAKPKTEKAASTKKAAAPKKAAAAKPKANTATKRKAPAVAPAIVEEKKVLGKTKSGRVTKTIAKPAAKPKAAPKKAAAKKETKKEESK